MSGGDEATVIAELKAALCAFNRERDWEQFHHPKDLAIALNVEAGELLEHFLWKQGEAGLDQEGLRQELADVFITALNLASRLDVDVASAVRDKLAFNAERYPVELARGNALKYDALARKGDGVSDA